MDERQRRSLTLGAAALAAALLLVWGLSHMTGRASPQEEPKVVLVHGDSGQREEMPLEQYVKGVVAGEMKPGWPVEAYAAQAILARTFALHFMESRNTNEIPADHEVAQAYNPANISPEIERAVEQTRGEVITYQGKPIRAWFHSYSGGETATAREGLDFKEEEPPYIKSVRVPDNDIVDAELKDWRVSFPAEEVARRLRERGVDVGEIQDIQIVERGPTDRITQVRITGTEGHRVISGPEFRLALGAMEMKSTKVTEFDFDPEQGLTVRGTGFGHGVGLSQWDAHMFARQGRSPEDIVRFFFQGVEIEKLWD